MPRSIATMTRQYGTGSLTTRTNSRGITSWYGQWRSNGRKITRKLGPVRQPGASTGLTEKGAEIELRNQMARVIVDKPADQAITIAHASRIYLTHLKRQGRKKSTITAVESCLRVWAIPFFRSTPMDRVTYQQIEDLIALMEHGQNGRKGLAPKSIHNYIGTIGALYAYGLNPRRSWATTNPVDGVELPAIPESNEIRYLTLEEVDALIRAVPDTVPQPRGHRQPIANPYADMDRVLYRVAAMTGLREGELVALRCMDPDFPTRKLRVRRNYVLGEDGTPKSRRSSRAVPMADEVAQVLAAWIPATAGDEDRVFTDPVTGGELDKSAILRRMRWALAAAGLKREHVFHDLRHTFGTRMAAAGVPMRTLQEWMGHRDIQTTMRYADYAPSAHEARMVDDAFTREGVPEGNLSEPKETHAT